MSGNERCSIQYLEVLPKKSEDEDLKTCGDECSCEHKCNQRVCG